MRTRFFQFSRGLTVGCALMLLTTACSSAFEPLASEPSVFESLAEQLVVPTDRGVQVSLVDFDAAYDLFGYRQPRSCDRPSQHQQAGDNYRDLYRETAVPAPPLYLDASGAPEEIEVAYGLTLCDIRSGGYGFTNHGMQQVYLVDADDDALRDAAVVDPVWSQHLAISEHGNGTLFDWGAEVPGVERSAGRIGEIGGQLHAEDGVIVTTLRSEAMDAFLDPETQRLIDTPGVATVLAELERLGAVSADLFDRWPTTEVPDEQLIAPWQLLGFGAGRAESGTAVAHVVLIHDTNDEAEANRMAVEERIASGNRVRTGTPWSDGLVIQRAEVDGVLLTMTLQSTDDISPMHRVAASWAYGENLFAMER